MRIRLLYYTHGNEHWGKDVCEGLAVPSRNANPAASAKGIRYVTEEMMNAYGKPADPANNEVTEATLITDETKDDEVVGDIHNNPIPGLEFAQIDPRYSDPRLVRVGAFLGFTTISLAESSFFKAIPQSLALEFSVPEDPLAYALYAQTRLPKLRQRLQALSRIPSLDDLPKPKEGSITYYRRAGYVWANDPHVPMLSKINVTHGFQELPHTVSRIYGSDTPLHAMSWNFQNQSEGQIFGSFAIKVAPPFTP